MRIGPTIRKIAPVKGSGCSGHHKSRTSSNTTKVGAEASKALKRGRGDEDCSEKKVGSVVKPEGTYPHTSTFIVASDVPAKVFISERSQDAFVAELDDALRNSLSSLKGNHSAATHLPTRPSHLGTIHGSCPPIKPKSPSVSGHQSIETASVSSSVQLRQDMLDKLSFDPKSKGTLSCKRTPSSEMSALRLRETSGSLRSTTRAVLVYSDSGTDDVTVATNCATSWAEGSVPMSCFSNPSSLDHETAVEAARKYIDFSCGYIGMPEAGYLPEGTIPSLPLSLIYSHYLHTNISCEAYTSNAEPRAEGSDGRLSSRTSLGYSRGGSGWSGGSGLDSVSGGRLSFLNTFMQPHSKGSTGNDAEGGINTDWDKKQVQDGTIPLQFPSPVSFLTSSQQLVLRVPNVHGGEKKSTLYGRPQHTPLELILKSNYLLAYAIASFEAALLDHQALDTTMTSVASIVNTKMALTHSAQVIGRQGAIASRSAATKAAITAQTLLKRFGYLFDDQTRREGDGNQAAHHIMTSQTLPQPKAQFVTLPMNQLVKNPPPGTLLRPATSKPPAGVVPQPVCNNSRQHQATSIQHSVAHPPHAFTVLPPRHAQSVARNGSTLQPSFTHINPPQDMWVQSQEFIFDFSRQATAAQTTGNRGVASTIIGSHPHLYASTSHFGSTAWDPNNKNQSLPNLQPWAPK